MNLQLVIAGLSLFLIYYLTGSSLKHIFRLKYKGFNVLIGFLSLFGLFHLLAIIPTLMHQSFGLIAYRILPFVFISAVLMILVGLIYFKHFEFERPNSWLVLSIVGFFTLFFCFDFIVYGDASYYLPLIKQNIDVGQVYLDGGSPWSGNPDIMIGNRHLFITYELYIGSLSSLFGIDSSIFTINVISAINLIIIMTSWYSFFSHLFKQEVKSRNAYLMFLFIFVLSNVNIHRIFHPLNAYQFMTNLYSGMALYLYAVLPLIFIILNKVSRFTKGRLFLMLFVLNLILPGLCTASLFMQVLISLAVIAYFLLVRQPEDITLGKFILATLTPLSLNYLLLIFLPNFTKFGLLLKIALLFITVLISISAYYLVLNEGIIIKAKKRLIRLWFIYTYILVAILSTGFLIYFLINNPSRINYVGVFIGEHFLNVYNLAIFYLISIMGMKYILKDDDREHQFSLIFFWLPIILAALFLNPFTGYLTARLITGFNMYHVIVYLFPLGYLAAYFLASKKHYKHLLIYILFILFPGESIFNNFKLLIHTNDDPHYRIDRGVVEVGQYFEQEDESYKVIGVTEITRGIRIVSTNVELIIDEYDLRQREYRLYDHEDLINLLLAVNDQAPFVLNEFKSVTNDYEVDKVIVYKNSAICMQLTYHGYEKKVVGKYAIFSLS